MKTVLARKLSSALAHAGRHLARRRGRQFAEYIEHSTASFHRALNNVNFDMTSNGELRVLKLMSSTSPECVFDVGANVGEWSQLAAELFPAATIHAFEIVPDTYAELQANIANRPSIQAREFGLSDEEGEIPIFLGSHGSTDATAFKIDGMTLHDNLYVNEVRGRVRTGFDYLSDREIPKVDFLKIDVEGMDLRVIKGFGEALSRVKVLQFEYGVFNISSHDLLADFWRHLADHGFLIGKIFPNTVKFSDYDFSMENFHGSNYLAVRRDQDETVALLSR